MSGKKALQNLEQSVNIEYYIGKKAADEIRASVSRDPGTNARVVVTKEVLPKATAKPAVKPATKPAAKPATKVNAKDA